jgi:hypothetical protein
MSATTSRHRKLRNLKEGKAVNGKTGTDAVMETYGNKRKRNIATFMSQLPKK